MTAPDLSLASRPAARGGLLAALLRALAAVGRLRRAPAPLRLSPHLLRDLGLTPAEYDGL